MPSTPSASFVSTGSLPPAEQVQQWVDEAHERFRGSGDGEVSDVYPSLARMPADLLGISLVGASGRVFEAGAADHPFTIMSVSKPFVLALVCERIGADQAIELLGADATGQPFNSLAAIEAGAGITNPMVNSGAIATTSLTPGAGVEDRWSFLREGLERFTGRALTLDDDVHTCAMETNTRNRSIAALLETYGTISGDPAAALDLYTRQCSLLVTARDLAVMGATLADGGVNPVTGLRVVSAETCHHVLALMLTAGMYETSGRWLAAVGLPAKSGIGGGIVTVSPGKGGLGTFAPRLDRAGNSVQGQEVARYLSARLGLDLLASAPAAREA